VQRTSVKDRKRARNRAIVSLRAELIVLCSIVVLGIWLGVLTALVKLVIG
jgi:hypothetical protein